MISFWKSYRRYSIFWREEKKTHAKREREIFLWFVCTLFLFHCNELDYYLSSIVGNWKSLHLCFFPLVLKLISLALVLVLTHWRLIFRMFQIVNHWNRKKMAWEAPKMQWNATLNAITAKHMNDEKSHIKLIWHFSEQKQTFFLAFPLVWCYFLFANATTINEIIEKYL